MAICPAAPFAPVASIVSQPVSLLPSLPHSATIPEWAVAVGNPANGAQDARIIRLTRIIARRPGTVVMGDVGFRRPFEGCGWFVFDGILVYHDHSESLIRMFFPLFDRKMGLSAAFLDFNTSW